MNSIFRFVLSAALILVLPVAIAAEEGVTTNVANVESVAAQPKSSEEKVNAVDVRAGNESSVNDAAVKEEHALLKNESTVNKSEVNESAVKEDQAVVKNENTAKEEQALLEVVDFVLAGKVEAREPQEIVEAFSKANERGFAFARLHAKAPAEVTFVWYRNDKPVARYTQNIQASKKWRTFSSVTLRPGQWKVQLLTNEKVLAEKSFVIE